MLKISFAVSEDEATLLTVMTRGLVTDVDVQQGKDLGYAKNRAIDKLWKNIPFCHAVAALSNLRMFDTSSGEELEDSEPVQDGQQVLLALEPPGGKAEASAAAEAFASVVSAVGRHKLGLDQEENKPSESMGATREELQKLSLKELKARLLEAGLSTEGCLEKGDLVDRLLTK
mmetsp:Transcript_32315/g.60842  ORF Transcript_32315/g.60842 Transcript_32315/m.60842 type:complete len:173 (+) Transcript_32315:21-539(+)